METSGWEVTGPICGGRPGDVMTRFDGDPVVYVSGLLNRQPPVEHWVPMPTHTRDIGAPRLVFSAKYVHWVLNHADAYEMFYWQQYLLFCYKEREWWEFDCRQCEAAAATGDTPLKNCEHCGGVRRGPSSATTVLLFTTAPTSVKDGTGQSIATTVRWLGAAL